MEKGNLLPLQYHRSNSRHYLEAKMKEMLFPYLGYLPEVDLSEFVSLDWKQRFVGKCIRTDLQFIQTHEKIKATEDLLKYYESLAVQAKHEMEMEIFQNWSIVLSNEISGITSESDLCRAWILRRAKEDKTFTSPLWFISGYLMNFPELSPLWCAVAHITFEYICAFQQMKGLVNMCEELKREVILEPFKAAVQHCLEAMDTKGLLQLVKKMKEDTYDISDEEELVNELRKMYAAFSVQYQNVKNKLASAKQEFLNLRLKCAREM
jgi:hypothetical protein